MRFALPLRASVTALAVPLALLLSACKSGEIGSPIGVTFSTGSQTMTVGESRVLGVTLSGGRSPSLESCTSANVSVATASLQGTGCAVTAVGPGDADITARAIEGSKSATASTRITVSRPPDAIADVTVNPSSVSLVVNETRGIVAQATGVGAGVNVTYGFQSLSANIATVDAAGVVRGIAPGTATVVVTANGSGTGFTQRSVTRNVQVIVSARLPGLTDFIIGLQPNTQPLRPGDERQLIFSASGPSAASAAYSYTMSTTGVIAISAAGLVSAIAPGNVTVTMEASVGEIGVFGATRLTRTLDILVAAAPAAACNIGTVGLLPGITLNIGGTQQIALGVTPATGATVNTTYSSNVNSVATVSANGLVSGVAPGTATITAQVTCTGAGLTTVTGTKQVPVTVNAAAAGLTGVTAAPGTVDLTAGQTFTSITPTPQGPLANQAAITYLSENTAIATVSATGAITGVATGTTRIRVTATTAAAPGFTASSVTAFVNVNVRSITLTLAPSPAVIGFNQQQQLTATVRDASTGAVITGMTPTFTSSNPQIATVTATGVVRMVGIGSANITAALGGQSSTATVTNVLANGVAVTISGATGSDQSFVINVPAGTTSLTVTLTGNNGDADLLVYRVLFSEPENCKSDGPDSNETCTIPTNGVTGLYEIRVQGFMAFTNVTLRATRTP